MGEKIVVTYETVFELLRQEKSRNELQELDGNFFQEFVEYIHEKQLVLKKTGMFAEEDSQRTIRQLHNLKKIIKELYERRERKIVDMALNKSKTHSDAIPDVYLLAEESVLLTQVQEVLDKHRKNILHNLLEARLPQREVAPEVPRGLTMVRFIDAVPAFLDSTLVEHGPFLEDDIANLPNDVGNILISSKRAIKMVPVQ